MRTPGLGGRLHSRSCHQRQSVCARAALARAGQTATGSVSAMVSLASSFIPPGETKPRTSRAGGRVCPSEEARAPRKGVHGWRNPSLERLLTQERALSASSPAVRPPLQLGTAGSSSQNLIHGTTAHITDKQPQRAEPRLKQPTSVRSGPGGGGGFHGPCCPGWPPTARRVPGLPGYNRCHLTKLQRRYHLVRPSEGHEQRRRGG